MKIIFATNNEHKLSEIRQILGQGIEVVSLADIGCHDDIPETQATIEGNAIQKAMYIYNKYKMPCFADDTGLEVKALGGEPGVMSARYAGGNGHDSEANMAKLLDRLRDKDNRQARFRTVIALVGFDNITANGCASTTMGCAPCGSDTPAPLLFEGIVNGHITTSRHGNEGFGYDPIFMPDGHNKTFAELGMDIKNRISHRALAVEKLAKQLLER